MTCCYRRVWRSGWCGRGSPDRSDPDTSCRPGRAGWSSSSGTLWPSPPCWADQRTAGWRSPLSAGGQNIGSQLVSTETHRCSQRQHHTHQTMVLPHFTFSLKHKNTLVSFCWGHEHWCMDEVRTPISSVTDWSDQIKYTNTYRIYLPSEQQQQGTLPNTIGSNYTDWRGEDSEVIRWSLHISHTHVSESAVTSLTSGLHVNAKVHVLEERLLSVVTEVNTCAEKAERRVCSSIQRHWRGGRCSGPSWS